MPEIKCSECQFEDGGHSQACSKWVDMARMTATYEFNDTDIDSEYRPSIDPASLLPFECRLEPDDPSVEKLTGGYSGSNSHSILDADSRNRGV